MDTKMKSRGLICSVLLGGLVAGAHAQMFGSFWRMTSINGITVTRSGLTYDVTLSSNSNDRYVTFVNHLNQVQTEYFNQVMGFFKVGDGVQLLGANGSNTFTNGATWKWYPDCRLDCQRKPRSVERRGDGFLHVFKSRGRNWRTAILGHQWISFGFR